MAIVKLAPAKNCGDNAPALEDLPVKMEWLLSCRDATASEVITGADGGMLLKNYIEQKGWGCLGTDARRYRSFPLSMKLISDSDRDLIQVNPYKERESLWYVVDAQPEAEISFGMADEIALEDFKEAVNQGTVGQMLQKISVKTGDVLEVEAGTVFAIGKGVTVLDIQKDSQDVIPGIDDVLSNVKLSPVDRKEKGQEWLRDGQASWACLGRNDVFDADVYQLNGRIDMDADSRSFKAIVFVDGSAVIEKDDQLLHGSKDNCFFVEADTHPFSITGNARFVVVQLSEAE